MSGSGLRIVKVSCPQIAAKRDFRPSCSSSRTDSHSSLLVQTARRQPLRGSARRARVRVRETAASGPRCARHRCRDIRRTAGRSRRADSCIPFEASARCSSGFTPAPIMVRASSNATAGNVVTREDDVERVDKVGRGVDQRAVEIEHDGGGGHWRSASAGRGVRQGFAGWPSAAAAPISRLAAAGGAG